MEGVCHGHTLAPWRTETPYDAICQYVVRWNRRIIKGREIRGKAQSHEAQMQGGIAHHFEGL